MRQKAVLIPTGTLFENMMNKRRELERCFGFAVECDGMWMMVSEQCAVSVGGARGLF